MNKSQQKICHAFIQIYKKKAFEDITIKKVCDTIPIARSTFYHYYDLCQGNDISLEIIAGYLISLFTYFLNHHLELNTQNLDKYLQILKKMIDMLNL